MIGALYDVGYLVNYKEGDIALYRTPLFYIRAVNDKFYITREGDTLLSIAQDHYNDQFYWYLLADINSDVIEDIFNIPINTTLVIPDIDLLNLMYG